MCINEIPGHVCSCAGGYILHSDGMSCLGTYLPLRAAYGVRCACAQLVVVTFALALPGCPCSQPPL